MKAIAFLLVLAALVGAVVLCGPTFAASLAGKVAGLGIESRAADLVPTGGASSEINITIDELSGLLENQAAHDERMADKIVEVAVSADAAQAAGSIGQGLVMGAVVLLFVVLFVVFLFLSRPAEGDR